MSTVFDGERLFRLAGRGCVMEWELFGQEQSLYALDLWDATRAHPEPPVQAALNRPLPSYAPQRAVAAASPAHRHRRERAVGATAASEGRDNAPGVLAGLRSGRAGVKCLLNYLSSAGIFAATG
jgi:hypothetical protein